uniref:Uncharacterized protein n=1 Tax=Arion vulgaris TaxID=1028688 RepID=A0A0B7ANT4_9EUPU
MLIRQLLTEVHNVATFSAATAAVLILSEWSSSQYYYCHSAHTFTLLSLSQCPYRHIVISHSAHTVTLLLLSQCTYC